MSAKLPEKVQPDGFVTANAMVFRLLLLKKLASPNDGRVFTVGTLKEFICSVMCVRSTKKNNLTFLRTNNFL